jgi:sigma-54 dependent transcriptional regulator, acetoin dehydrogenase operon transcriptional activator AcoR
MAEFEEDRSDLERAWHHFVETGEVDGSIIRKEIADSWRRCRKYGLDPLSRRATFSGMFSEFEVKARFKKNEALIRIARPFLSHLYALIKDLRAIIFLTDAECLVLDIIADDMSLRALKQLGLKIGDSVHEKVMGTGGCNLAAFTGKPERVILQEHYSAFAQVAAGCAAPIFDNDQNVIGVIEVSGEYAIVQKHPHTLGLVVAAARTIESQIDLLKKSEKLALTNEYLRTVINQINKGLLIFSSEGRLTHISPSIRTMLDLHIDWHRAAGRTFYELLPSNSSLIELLESDKEFSLKEVILKRQKGQSRFLVTIKNIVDSEGEKVGRYAIIEELKDVRALVHRIIGATARYHFSDILGQSRTIRDVVDYAMEASRSNSTVMILGESGTGKEMFAQAIHNAGIRSHGPFVALNCAALPASLIESELFGYEEGAFTGAMKKGSLGKFELADQGTLFLDEIDKMPLEMQFKLLRVLEDQRVLRLGGRQYLPIDVRIIAAANMGLTRLIAEGLFSEELFYRLNVLRIHLPPLRERKEDISTLVDFFIRIKSQAIEKTIKGISREALDYLVSLDWPGNVRELENLVERAIHFSKQEILSTDDFKILDNAYRPIRGGGQKETSQISNFECNEMTLSEVEREAILSAIKKAAGNLSLASRFLGIHRSFLYRKIRKHGIEINSVLI